MNLLVGRVVRPHGVRGAVVVEVRTDDPDARFAPGTRLSTEPAEAGPLTVAWARWHAGRLLVGFDGVDGRDSAAQLRGTHLVIDAAELPPTTDPDEFYDHQLRGLTVVTDAGDVVGVVSDVTHEGQDLLIVDRDGESAALIPFVKAIVTAVDLPGGRLTVTPPPGLLD